MTRHIAEPFPLDDLNAAVQQARELFQKGDFNACFDLYELLLDRWPADAVPLLADLYDLYQALPDQESRYGLYQARHIDFDIRPGDRVLDVGSGHLPFPFATHLTDISLQDGSIGRAGTPFKFQDGKPVFECDVEQMPFGDQEFDFVYCSHVLEHVSDPEKACRELMRVGKRGYIETPTRGKDVWLDMTRTSNHRWWVEWFNDTLVFTETPAAGAGGLGCGILLDMHCAPQTPREKAFSALIYLKAPVVNTMVSWEGSFRVEVRRRAAAIRPKASWRSTMEREFVKLYAGDVPAMAYYDDCIGLSINQADSRHIPHDLTEPLPIPDNSVHAFQAEDVLEHIEYRKLPAVLDEIFRVLKPGGYFRLSVPDYGCDLLRERSLKDASGQLVFDPGGGGTPENPGHVWFPRIDNVRALVQASAFARYGSADFLHYYNMDGSYVTRQIDYSRGHVDRTPDFDDRVQSPYRPMSLVVDLFKMPAPEISSGSDRAGAAQGGPLPAAAGGASCLYVNTYYDAFLIECYGKHPALLSASYQDQKSMLIAQFFGDSDFYSEGLKKAGWRAEDLIVNAEPLQQAWAHENAAGGTGLALVVEQIAKARPDCVYLQNLGMASAEFLAAIRPHTKLIVGQIAYPLPGHTDLTGFDIIFSSFPHFVERFRAAGVTSYYQPLAFEPRVLEALTKFSFKSRPVECSFVGGISPQHGKGYQLLETLAGALPIDFWGYGAETLAPDSAIRERHHGEAWGRDMFYLLGASKITINRHIDVAENNANNMRLFEATGCGALLITDYKDNLGELFEIGKEVVAYHTPEECIELVRYYLAHPEEAEKIARAGQARTLRDHVYLKRMEQTAKILSRHLRNRRDRETLVLPGRISDGYRTIETGEITAEQQSAWQSPEIPPQQRALVQQQLEQMYRGASVQPFQVLGDLLAPVLQEGAGVLEIGCASGYYYEVLEYLLNKEIAYTGADYSAPMIDLARSYYPEANFLVADGAKLPFAERSFPVVISGCVLLHTPDYARHIAETCRVAGKWIVAHRTPVCRQRPTGCSSKMAYGVETVEFRFNETELLELFARHGFRLAKACTYHEQVPSDEYETSYLLERGPQPADRVPYAPPAPPRNPPELNRGAGPVVLVSRAIAFTFPLSYAYLAGQLRAQGEDVRVLFKDIPAQALVKQIMDLNPLIVGFGNLYPELAETRGLIQMLDDAGRKFPIVIGGQMVSPTPEFAVKVTRADYGVIGEGELILGELVKRLRNGTDPSDIKGLVVRRGNEVKSNGPGAFIENLSTSLPTIPYDLFPTDQWLPIGAWYARHLPVPHWKVDDRVINVHGGRGCPYTCNFCYHHSKARYRDIGVMMEEAQEALIRFDGNMLYFSDDLVMASPKRARQLIEAIGTLDRPVSFQISTRFDILSRMDDELLRDLKRVGCRSMGLGLESGSDRVLQLIGKNCNVQQIEDGLERLNRVGIYPTTSIMLGQHTETVEDAAASIALMQRTVRRNPYLNYAFTLTTPFPGSALYNLIFEKGILKTDQDFYDLYFSSAGEFKQVINLSAMSDAEVSSSFAEIHRVYDIEKRKANALLGIG
jgi:radical SAM superfamily enzyme YgiQ (UPF0313 family)/ubiquinone/menaquinone biosynthesis C-methylase UbiE